MRKFTCSTVDNKTGLELILSEAGYNEAMFFVECNFVVLDCHQTKDHDGNTITIIDTTKRTLLYDEARAVLMGD